MSKSINKDIEWQEEFDNPFEIPKKMKELLS